MRQIQHYLPNPRHTELNLIFVKRNILLSLFIGLIVLSEYPGFSQPAETRQHRISASFLQTRESLNHGLVFRGPGIDYGFAYPWHTRNRTIRYEAAFGFNYLEGRGIAAGNLHAVPVRLTYLFHASDDSKLRYGPFVIGEYQYALYPDLQSGYSFWFTHFSLGCEMNYDLRVAKTPFKVRLRSTVLGYSSRPPVYRDAYFFDLGFGYAIDFLHSNLQFGSWNKYNQSELEIRWQLRANSRINWAYALQYAGYYDAPRLTMLDQAIKIIILPKRKRHE